MGCWRIEWCTTGGEGVEWLLKNLLIFSNNPSLDLEMSSCHLFPSNNWQCLSLGNPRNLCTDTSICIAWLLATHSLANSKWVEQNPSTGKLSFVLIPWIVCNVPLFQNVLTLLCYVMLNYLFIYEIEYDVVIKNVENVNHHTGVQCIPSQVHICTT